MTQVVATPAFVASARLYVTNNAVKTQSPIAAGDKPPQWSVIPTALRGSGGQEESPISEHDCNLRPTMFQPLINNGSKRRPKQLVIATSIILSSALLMENFDVTVQNSFSLQTKASAIEIVKQNSPSDSDGSTLSTWPPTSDQDLFKLSQGSSSRVSTSIRPRRYWDIMQNGDIDEVTTANEKLIDNAVATINTMYYDSSGGFAFNPKEFYDKWKNFRYLARHGGNDKTFPVEYQNAFATRENTVKTMKWLVSSIGDPYSKYFTREELTQELVGSDNSFLGLGALVEVPNAADNELLQLSAPKRSPDWNKILALDKVSNRNRNGQWEGISTDELAAALAKRDTSIQKAKTKDILSVNQASNLPIIKAIVPDSPAERAGLVVGDRIASVGTYQFTGMSLPQVKKALDTKFHAENYFGQADLTIAKPITAARAWDGEEETTQKYVFQDGWYQPARTRPRVYQNRRSEHIIAFRLTHSKSIPTTLTAGAFKLDSLQLPVVNGSPETTRTNIGSESNTKSGSFPSVIGGDAIVHYAILTSDDSIFQKQGARPVGYIRLTRFSKASTTGYINAIKSLEAAGVDSYIIDVRNNYGGVIQEAMLTASTLIRDPHSVLCYTLNGRGGFRPQENMEYIVDNNYPGYLLSSEPTNVAIEQVKREHPEYFEDGWSSPTSYASLRELKETRGIKPAHAFTYTMGMVNDDFDTEMPLRDMAGGSPRQFDLEKLSDILIRSSQKKVVILINEGTASAAEVFASALHDNGRAIALIGTDTFGKGLIQHTFPMPDGGGLRLTVAEYLTPTLSHVTKVGGARLDSGIHPDVRCESKQGIPKNIGSDLCVGVALDVLDTYQ